MGRLPVVPDLGAYLREQRIAARLSLRELAERAGMSNPYLSQVERGLRKPSAEILGALADALDLSAEALYVRAGILEAPARDADVVAAIAADPALSDAQKRSLVDLYRLFVADRRSGREEHDAGHPAPEASRDHDAPQPSPPAAAPLPAEAAGAAPGGGPSAGAPAGPGPVAPSNVIALPTAAARVDDEVPHRYDTRHGPQHPSPHDPDTHPPHPEETP